MIILFEENETLFQNLGLGLLRDARSCVVKETLNDSFELELQYPITGSNFSKIKLNRIILSKTNPYDSDAQPFRIYSISKPINGIITVRAFHISYDMNGIVVGPINGSTPKLTLDQIQNKVISEHNFKFYTDLTGTKTFKTSNYYNMRSLLMGSSESILETYKGELLFDKFNVYVLSQRGSNKGASVRYAKNMKDVVHEVNYDRLYNGVYPYYHQETSETTTETSSDGFKQVYIVGTKPFQDGWLSYEPDGEPYHPVDESPVQIMTEGDYYNKVYSWNTTTQRYTERIYNEMVNLIECVTGLLGMSDKPSWIYIDVTGLPNIVVKAAEAGYFKLATDPEWTKHIKGEVVFEGSITNATDGLLMYYSEVIPESTSASEVETVNVTHVELKDKILWLETDAAKEMKYDRILCLDLTSEFDEVPDEEQLETKAKEYIDKNKIGQYKYDTRVSFIDLSSTTEGAAYEKMESVELGDTVKVVYENLGIDVDLRVVSTTYNVLLNRYDNIDLGEKSEKISASSVQTGDNVSSLSNDVGYTDITTVNKLIAKTITADLIQAKNAKLSKAQIEELQTARIKITGMIEATQFELDTLVAKMLTADNAIIKQTLEAGTVKVKGDITVTSGSIKIESTESGTVFNVDRDGNVTANSVHITGGELNINDTFTVTPDGILTALGADIQGRIEAESGSIAKFNIESDTIEGDTHNRIWSGTINTSNYVLVSPGYNAIITNLDSQAHDWAFAAGANFGVDNQGNLYAKSANISGTIEAELGKIAGFEITSTNIHTIDKSIGSDKSVWISSSGEYALISNLNSNHRYWSLVIDNLFGVTRDGEIFAKSVDLTGKITATSGKIAGFEISNDTFKLIANNIEISPTQLSYGSNGEFTVLPNGTVKIQNGSNPSAENYQGIVLDSNGLTASSINVKDATISFGKIGGFNIGENALYKEIGSFDAEGSDDGVYLGPDGIRIGKNLKIYPDGRIISASRNYDANVSYKVGDYAVYNNTLYECIEDTSGVFDSTKWKEISNRYFGIDETGKLTAVSAEIVGNIVAESGYIGSKEKGFHITENAIYNGFDNPTGSSISTGVYIGTDGIRLGQNVSDGFELDRFDSYDISGTYISRVNYIPFEGYIIANVHDATTNEPYLKSEFVLSYDSVSYDRWIKVREKSSPTAIDNDDDYIHDNNPGYQPIVGKTINDEEVFDINSSDYTKIVCDQSNPYNSMYIYNKTTDMFDFVGASFIMNYDRIDSVAYALIEFYPTQTDLQNRTNMISSRQLEFGSSLDNIVLNISGEESPYFSLKIIGYQPSQTFDENCWQLLNISNYDSTKKYFTGDKCKYNNKIYTCKFTTQNPAGEWDYSNWIEENVEQWSSNKEYLISDMVLYNNNVYQLYVRSSINELTNCSISQENPHLVKLPKNTTSISFIQQKYRYIKISFYTHNSETVVQETNAASNLKIALKTLPGFLVTPDGMMQAYNAKIYGSFIGDIKIVGGSISIASSNDALASYIRYNSTIAQLQDMCSVLGLTYSGVTRTRIAILELLPASGIGSLTGGQLEQLYSICGLTYSSTVFNVTEAGYLTATAGNIAGFEIDDKTIRKNTPGTASSVLMSIGSQDTTYTIAGQTKDTWAFTAGVNFGVDITGNLYAASGIIGPLEVTNTKMSYGDASGAIFELYPQRYNPDGSADENSYTMFAKSAQIQMLDLGYYWSGLSPNRNGSLPNFSREYGLYNITVIPETIQGQVTPCYYYDGRIKTQDIKNILYLKSAATEFNTSNVGRQHNMTRRLSKDPSYLNGATNPFITMFSYTFGANETTRTFTPSNTPELAGIHKIVCVIPMTRTTGFFETVGHPKMSWTSRISVYWNDEDQFAVAILNGNVTYYFLVIGF